jgi:glycosyltransferase involved in cell wall biosynthesis
MSPDVLIDASPGGPDSPLVCIIIPCWNAEGSIGDAIKSALAQTYQNVEVIVIDDGSTDNSLDVIKSFGSRIRWESGPNDGAPSARNKGLALARGEWIQFLDSDDLLDHQKIERQLAVAKKQTGSIVYCDRRVISNSQPSQISIERPIGSEDPVILCVEKIVHTSAPLYRKTVLDHVGGYREGLRCCQDYDLHLRLAVAGYRYLRLSEDLFTVRRQPGSISSDLLVVYRQMVSLWRELVRTLAAGDELTAPRRACLAAAFASKGRWFYRHRLPREAWSCFEDAVALDKSAADLAYGSLTRLMKSVVGRWVTEQIVQIGSARPRK